MNDLVKALIEGIISEDESPKKKIIGMFGGGFKPPTSGHLEVVKRALQENPEMDALIILVGSGTRNSISQEESLAIWNIYKKSLPNKVRVMASPDNKPPIGAIYSYAKKNSDKEIYWFIGAREGNEGDFQDIASRTKSLRKGDYSNIKVKEIVTGGSVSGTKARQALLAKDKETFIQFLPNIPEIDEIWDMLTDVVKERISFTPDFISQNDVDFVDNMADRKLSPIDIDLSGNHFFDRLNDPRNYPDISVEELEDFFDKLSDEKEDFIEFLKKYKDVVVKDTETNINIPFMKQSNKAIAKTIMRKKNFMTSNKVLPLEEGRYDAEVTMISRMIINYFKETLGKKVSNRFEDAGVLGDDTYDLEVYLTPTDFDTLGPIPFIVNAAGDENGIAIQVNYNPESFPKAYNDLIPELKDAIRHELEHTAQFRFDKGVSPDGINQDDLSLFDYLTLNYEIPAFVQGLYKKAKTKKITFTAAVDEFLDERVEELMPEEAAKVKQIYIDYAKKNLPAAQLDEEITEDSIICDNCGWTWKIVDGGNDLYICHKCNHNNTPLNEDDPKKGTGKKPKGSGRRLYTDEDPKDTVGIKFSSRQDIVDTLGKTSFKNKSHARQSQVINLIHQRVRAAYGRSKKPEVKKRLKTALNYITKRKEASKAKTQRLKNQKKKTNEAIILEVVPKDILDSFDIQDTLVKDVWDGLNLKPEIKEKLLLIAQDFFNSLELPEGTVLKDIKLTGSLANFNWSKFSDVDLHLVIDFTQISDSEKFAKDYFDAKKNLWNNAHDINIFGYPVEVYVEDIDESHTASGLYSVLNDKWITIPQNDKIVIDKDDVKSKAEGYFSYIPQLEKMFKDKEYEQVVTTIDQIKEKIRNMRSSGLENGGLYSVENLAFKVLRRSNFVEELNTLKTNSYDAMMSLDENVAPNHNQKSAPYGSGYKPLKEDLTPQIISLTQYMASNGLNLKPYPKVKFIDNDGENASNLLGRTAYYDPNQQLVALYTMGRHPKDILRSYAHELVHHHQNLNNTLNHGQTTNTKKDDALDRIEREAYENGNILFRNWEDSIKNQ